MKICVPALGRLGLLVLCASMMTALGIPVQAQVVIDGSRVSIDGEVTNLTPDEGLQIQNNAEFLQLFKDAKALAAANAASTAGDAKSNDLDAAAYAAAKATADANAATAAAAAQNAPTADSFMKATHTTMTKAELSGLMSKSVDCMKRNWVPAGRVCCLKCHDSPDGCCPKMWADSIKIDYWEPSEIIEVSCRSGYSMLSPGNVPTRGGSSKEIQEMQSCQGFDRPGNSRWFFEARVWTINGYKGGLRHQALGGTNGEKLRQCTLEGGDNTDLPWPGLPSDDHWGYGVKWLKFSRGAANGPAGSWEAYISDSDKSWGTDAGASGAKVAAQKPCSIGGVDIANCWGPLTPTGFVNHPNPKVAAALAAWRAHTKAVGMNKVSPAGTGGYQMAMEYPYVDYGGAYAGSMGAPNGGKNGSSCFQPGNSGPEWFGGMQPTSIPDFVKGLKPGTKGTVAEVNPGVYIFTVWVHTSCLRFKGMLKATPICHYMNGT